MWGRGRGVGRTEVGVGGIWELGEVCVCVCVCVVWGGRDEEGGRGRG